MIQRLVLLACLIILSSAAVKKQKYSASDCKGNNRIRDIGLNPSEFRRKAKIVFQQGEAGLEHWHARHLGKFDPNFVRVTSLILEEGETLQPHLFISEEHVMQCADKATDAEVFRFVQEVQAQNIILEGLTTEQVDLELVRTGFEMIEGDTEAMTAAEYVKFEATNKQKFQRRKH
jgi:hypothetical protein